MKNTIDLLVLAGSAVKALGHGRVGGYLALFGGPSEADLVGDYFTADTDFDLERDAKSTVYYGHGLDETIGRRKLGVADLKTMEAGVWAETQLNLRDEYELAIYELAKEGKLGWSSGTAAHLVERQDVGGAQFVSKWPLGLDASLTPTPCEPRSKAMPLKSVRYASLTELKALLGSNEKRDILRSAVTAKHGSGAEVVDHDDDNVYWMDWASGQHYASPYRMRRGRAALADPAPVRIRTVYVPLDDEPSKSISPTVVPHSGITLSDHLDSALSAVGALVERLSDLKDWRTGHGRPPLGANARAQAKSLRLRLDELLCVEGLATDPRSTSIMAMRLETEINADWIGAI